MIQIVAILGDSGTCGVKNKENDLWKKGRTNSRRLGHRVVTYWKAGIHSWRRKGTPKTRGAWIQHCPRHDNQIGGEVFSLLPIGYNSAELHSHVLLFPVLSTSDSRSLSWSTYNPHWSRYYLAGSTTAWPACLL